MSVRIAYIGASFVLLLMPTQTTRAFTEECTAGLVTIERFNTCDPKSTACIVSGFYQPNGPENQIQIEKRSNSICAADESNGLLKLSEIRTKDGNPIWVSRGDVFLRRSKLPQAHPPNRDPKVMSPNPAPGCAIRPMECR